MVDEIIDSIFEENNFEWLCQADTEDINRYKGKLRRKLRKKAKELLDKVVKAERKYDLIFSNYIMCEGCGTIAYGDGNCHCKKNKWKIWDFDLREKIKEVENEIDKH